MRQRLAEWLDLRPSEVRTVALSFVGAFLTISFLILARSLREAFYLSRFAVETLPYITASAALLSVPTAGLFARLISGISPKTVLLGAVTVLGAGILVLWPFMGSSDIAVVVFYLWTALGTLLVTSGFWLVTAELFPIRGAKRVFGLIGAGGTAGAMIAGTLLAALTTRFDLVALVPGLVGVLVLFFLVELALPRLETTHPTADSSGGGSSVRDGLRLAWTTPHLRIIALIVAVASIASTLIDYQFKELARASLDSGEALAGFFGAFYGWTGAISLGVQVLVTARLLGRAGIAITLSVLPAILLLGSAGLLILPSLVIATVARGADNSLRKSLHRSVLEVLYVPVPASLRRRTKTFIDSVADSAAEGTGAALVFLIVTLGGFPSRWLSVIVAALAVYFLWLARRAQVSYRTTVSTQLREGARASESAGERGLLSAGFTQLDLRPALEGAGLVEVGGAARVAIATTDLTAEMTLVRGMLDDIRPPEAKDAGRSPGEEAAVGRSSGSTPAGEGVRALAVDGVRPPAPGSTRGGGSADILAPFLDGDTWGPEHIPLLTRLLARDSLYRDVSDLFADLEADALVPLGAILGDPAADFSIRRRIPAVLAGYTDVAADAALLDGIGAPRFEVRYRSAVGLVRRRREGLAVSDETETKVWAAIRTEVSRERPVWELQRLLDDDDPDDTLVVDRVGSRGQLSLEHTFRLLSLVLEPEAVSSAYRGLNAADEHLRSLSLEFLEHALPDDVRARLWPFIGDLSERRRRREVRSLDQVVSDLITTSATYLVSDGERGALKRLLEEEGKGDGDRTE